MRWAAPWAPHPAQPTPGRMWSTHRMTATTDESRVVSATREIDAPADLIFEYIADPAKQPLWDGNDNLGSSSSARVRAVGEVFEMTLAHREPPEVRENHVVEFEEGRRIAWLPSPVGGEAPGHLWRWELEPISAGATRVTHTYDWTKLTDEQRMRKARSTTSANLDASLARLDEIVSRDLDDWPPQDA